MNQAIDITTNQRKTILALLKKHLPNTTAWVYGSRVKWTSRPQSDLDMVVFSALEQHRKISDLREAFDESNLPFRVDLFEWDEVPEQFRKQIEGDHVVLVEKEVQSVAGERRDTVYGPINSDFSENCLADLCDPVSGVQTGPFGSQLHQKDYVPVGTPILTVEHLGENRIIHQDLPCVSDYDKERLSKYTLRKGDIVFSRVGSVDRRALVREAEEGWLFSGRCLRVRPDPKEVNPAYLSYFFGLPVFQEYIRSIAVGATMPSLNTRILSDALILYPPLSEQRAIAHILGTLDDKIELNRRMNQTLEAMARALFKSWFVDFDPVRAKIALKHRKSITPPLRGSRQGKGASPQASRWGKIKRLYSPQTLKRAKALRQSQSNAEGLLWHYLRKKQLDGHKFRRQQPIGRYIVDFVCMPKKLVIELDGGQHSTQKAYDKQRDQFLTERGYRVLRFWNSVVFENCYGVLERILAALQNDATKVSESPPSPLPNHSPLEGESERQGPQPAGKPVRGRQSKGASPKLSRSPVSTPLPGGNNWTVERAKAYLERMPPDIADLFPDQLVPSELGEIPEGWEVKALGVLIELAYGKSLKADDRKKGPIPVYGSNGQVGWHDKKLAVGPGIVVGRKGNPGVVRWVHSDFFPIDTTFYVVPRETDGDLPFLFFALTAQNLPSVAADSAVPGLNRNLAYMNRQLIPEKKVIAEFNHYAREIFTCRHRLKEESRTLAIQRDVLLPKLISGELQVKRPCDL